MMRFKKSVLALVLFLSESSFAEAKKTRLLADLDALSMDIGRFTGNRDPSTPDINMRDYRGRVRLNFNLNLFGDLVKWDNALHGEGTDAKFTTLGWHYMLRVPTRFGIEPFYEHHSRHTLDSTQPVISGRTKPERFPVEDSYGIRIIFFDKTSRTTK